MNTITMTDEILEITNSMFGDNHSEITEYYIETICGEDMCEYYNNVDKYDNKEIEAFRWGAEWLIEYMMTNDRIPVRSGSKYKNDENFIAWLIDGYEEEYDELKKAMIQINRNRLLDELLS